MGDKPKIRQTPKKTSTYKKEDFVQRSTKSGSSKPKSGGTGRKQTRTNKPNMNVKTVLGVKKK